MNHVPDIFENSDTSNCNYVIPESFLDDNSHILKDNLSIISCNIRSFSKNHPYFLGFLANCKHDFDIIEVPSINSKSRLVNGDAKLPSNQRVKRDTN